MTDLVAHYWRWAPNGRVEVGSKWNVSCSGLLMEEWNGGGLLMEEDSKWAHKDGKGFKVGS